MAKIWHLAQIMPNAISNNAKQFQIFSKIATIFESAKYSELKIKKCWNGKIFEEIDQQKIVQIDGLKIKKNIYIYIYFRR